MLALRRLVNHKEGTLELTQPKVQRNSLPNHKGKGVAAEFIAKERVLGSGTYLIS